MNTNGPRFKVWPLMGNTRGQRESGTGRNHMTSRASKGIYWLAPFAVCGSLLCGSPAWADDLPSGPIKIIVGFGPSSTADTVARLVARYITDKVGHPVIVENRPGNSSMVAAEYVAHAANDGRTLFMSTIANTLY